MLHETELLSHASSKKLWNRTKGNCLKLLNFRMVCYTAIESQSTSPNCCCCCRFSHVRFSATPDTAAHQAPPSVGFSRQEHWSGLPFPSPMHESEKWKWSRSVVSNSLQPHGLQPTRLLPPWDFPDKSTGVGCHCLLHSMLCGDLNEKEIQNKRHIVDSLFCT